MLCYFGTSDGTSKGISTPRHLTFEEKSCPSSDMWLPVCHWDALFNTDDNRLPLTLEKAASSDVPLLWPSDVPLLWSSDVPSSDVALQQTFPYPQQMWPLNRSFPSDVVNTDVLTVPTPQHWWLPSCCASTDVSTDVLTLNNDANP